MFMHPVSVLKEQLNTPSPDIIEVIQFPKKDQKYESHVKHCLSQQVTYWLIIEHISVHFQG